MFVKGSHERVLDMCSAMYVENVNEALDRASVLEAAHEIAANGLRVLAMAYGRNSQLLDDRHSVPEPCGLPFLGMAGMFDPPREGVNEAVAGCQDAGIQVVMITGDDSTTENVIARQLGI